jgi:hypothetical protein
VRGVVNLGISTLTPALSPPGRGGNQQKSIYEMSSRMILMKKAKD